MTNFDEFKQRAKDTMETIADKSIELYKIAEEKTKVLAKITKLTTELALEKATVRRLYKEIGKKYYELHKSAPEEALAQACAEVTVSLETITAKATEINELKKSINDKTEAESAVDDDAAVEIIIEDLNEIDPDGSPAETADLDENTAEAENIEKADQ